MRRLIGALVVLVLVAAGCGSGTGVQTTAETEGLYLDIDGLTYQIEMSRYLNPADLEDREYFTGLSSGTAQPAGDETWFGVWVRVENQTGRTLPSADRWEIHDTQDNVYRPIPIDTKINPFVYQAQDVPAGNVLPQPSTAAGQGPTQGLLLIFKLKTDSLQNRPLELKFGTGELKGTYDLDV